MISGKKKLQVIGGLIPIVAASGLWLWHRRLHPPELPGFEMSLIDRELFQRGVIVTGIIVVIAEWIIVSRFRRLSRADQDTENAPD